MTLETLLGIGVVLSPVACGLVIAWPAARLWRLRKVRP